MPMLTARMGARALPPLICFVSVVPSSVAVHEASGNQFEGVTDGRGVFRIPVRVGTYRISADLAGFTRVELAGTLAGIKAE